MTTPETQLPSRPVDLLASAVAELRPKTIYCQSCGYTLVGLSAGKCPECGHSFDPLNPFTTTAETGKDERNRFDRFSVLSLIVIVLLPIVLAPFTDVLGIDLIAGAALVLAVRVVEGRKKGGDWLAVLFGVYALFALFLCVALNPVDPASWAVRRHQIPVWHPLIVAILSLVNLALWRRWSLARRSATSM